MEQFFNRLDWLLPGERGTDGTPSITDFLLLDLPATRDAFAADYCVAPRNLQPSGIRTCATTVRVRPSQNSVCCVVTLRTVSLV
jgi:hypothetical protein